MPNLIQFIAHLLHKEPAPQPETDTATDEKMGSDTWIVNRLLIVAMVIAICWLAKGIIVPVLFAIVISVLIFPVVRLLEKWYFPRALASISAVIVAVIIIAGLGYMIVSQMINIGRAGEDIVNKLSDGFTTVQTWIEQKFHVKPYEQTSQLENELKGGVSRASGMFFSFAGSLGSILADFVMVIIYTFFFLYYRLFFHSFFFLAFKSTPKVKVAKVLDRILEVIKSYLYGLGTVMLIVAVLNAVGLYILGIQYAWFFGLLASLLMLIPYIGLIIGSILPAVFALATKDSAWYAVGVIGWFQMVQFLEGNFITPNIVGGKVSVNPFFALISILVFSYLLGFAGMILALPLTAVLKVAFDASPSMEAFGYLLGDPDEKFTKIKKRV